MRRSILLLLLCGCASQVLIPAEQRAMLERDLTGKDKDKYLRLSMFATPFFGDASKKLVTPVPPDEIEWFTDPTTGKAVSPGAIEKILPAGARVRVTKVEFPTAFAMAERVPFTPRTQPWVYLQVEGMALDVPVILVLRPQIKSHDEFLAEVDRYLAHDDPAQSMAAWTDAVRDAIKAKTAIVDMPADALEMAWGYPEKKKKLFDDNGAAREEWHYTGDRRVAYLADGRVTKVEGGGKSP